MYQGERERCPQASANIKAISSIDIYDQIHALLNDSLHQIACDSIFGLGGYLKRMLFAMRNCPFEKSFGFLLKYRKQL